MPSTYSSNLKLELMATGENSGTWGNITNTNLGTAAEQAIVGLGNVDYVSDANLTISITNSNAAQAARALVLNVTSSLSLTNTRELVVPTIEKQYIVQNNTTGGQSITVKTSAGTGITVPNGRKAHLYVNGTNVIQMFDFVDINGGTIDGATVGANSASTGAFTSLTASGATTLNGAVALGDAAADLITVPGTVNSHVLFTDNLYDIGASGATRPRNLFLAGNATIGGATTMTGALTVDSTTDSTSTITGSIQTDGGLGVAKALFVGTTANIAGAVTLSGGTANGVAYLNGSKVLTTGSALVFDGSKLLVGSNTAGYGTLNVARDTTTPYASLTVTDEANAANTVGLYLRQSGASAAGVSTAGAPLAFYLGGAGTSEQMRLTSTGLGIGTTPSFRLDVGGQDGTNIVLRSTGTTAAKFRAYVNSAESGVIGFLNGGGQYFEVAGSEQMRLTSTGLGIGITSPGQKLHVENSVNSSTWTKISNGNSGTGAAAGVLFGTDQGDAGALSQNSSNAGYGTAANAVRLRNLLNAPITFETNNTERARIDSSGNLGLGVTPNGSYRLEVNGGGLLTGLNVSTGGANNSANTATFDTNGAGAARFYSRGANASTVGSFQWRLQSSNGSVDTQAMTLDASGNLGVGTTSPTNRLSVTGSTGTIASFTNGATADFSIICGSSITSLNAGGANILAFQTGGSERARITSGGDLLVGDTANSAGARLYVKGSGATSGSVAMVVRNSTPSDLLYIRNDGYMTFGISPAMTLDASGNLDLGTTGGSDRYQNIIATSAKLTFNAGTGFTGSAATSIYNQSAIAMIFGTNNTERARITSGGYFKASDTGAYVNSTGSYHELRNTASSQVLYATATNASYASSVIEIATTRAANGAFNMLYAAANSVAQFYVTGDGVIYAQNTTVQSASDVRLKENIRDASDGLNIITSLRPVRFDFKKGYGNDRTNQLGFIAQEIEPVFPDAVSVMTMDEPTGNFDAGGNLITEKVEYKTVGPGALIPVLVKAIQEQQALIQTLTARVAQLEGK